jgi:hypothetical protein
MLEAVVGVSVEVDLYTAHAGQASRFGLFGQLWLLPEPPHRLVQLVEPLPTL